MNTIQTKNNFWLLLEKSDDTRIYGSLDSYNDTTGEIYKYDSLVQNHLGLSENDTVLIRKENAIIGYGFIGNISKKDGTKISRRCPKCETTAISTRKTKNPKWKCGRCSHEFSNPIETTREVVLYTASIESFVKMSNAPDVKTVKKNRRRCTETEV